MWIPQLFCPAPHDPSPPEMLSQHCGNSHMEMLNNHRIGDGEKDYVEDHLGQYSKNSQSILLGIMLDYTI